MQATFTTLLMFGGQAEEAMRFYTSIFDASAIERYGTGEPGAEGSVKLGR